MGGHLRELSIGVMGSYTNTTEHEVGSWALWFDPGAEGTKGFRAGELIAYSSITEVAERPTG